MAKRSKKAGPGRFKISEPDPRIAVVDQSKPPVASSDEPVSVSLKYFYESAECFSAWQKAELKKFTATLVKMRGYSVGKLQVNKSLCDKHKGPPSRAKFRRPDSLSEDLSFHEIKVDPSNKLRMHGVFIDATFFLVWLDREHAVFRS